MGDAYITRRGGGAPLNFKVVGGTKPSNPKENTIWVNTDAEITGWQFASDDPNLLDFNAWANSILVNSGTKSVSGNAITLTANANDCHTTWGAVDTSAVIPCKAGKTYVFEWNHSGSYGYVYLFPNASTENLVHESASVGKIEYTATEGVTFFTFRIGVSEANTTATYSNIRITEKERAFKPGTVWIQTGTTSPVAMNALKKNSIQVCPLNAKQYVGGAWALKDAETYQGGKWNDWAYWIIGNGANGLDITGGFTSNYENQWSFADDGSLTFYKDIDNMYSSFNVPSKRTFDVTNYNSMTIKVSSFSRNASYIGVNAPSNLGKDSTCRVKISAAGTYTLDISAISGEVHLQADLDYNGVTMVVSELYFS